MVSLSASIHVYKKMLVLLGVLVLVLWVAALMFRRRRLYKLAALIASTDKDLPVIGIAHTLIGNSQENLQTLQYFSYESMKNNGIIKSWMFHYLYAMVVNPADLEVILKTSLEKDDLLSPMREVLGNGIVYAPVSIWRRRRKILVPAFKQKNIDGFIELFVEQTEGLLKNLDRLSDNEVFDAWSYISAYYQDTACETAMGVKISTQINRDNPFETSVKRVLDIIAKRLAQVWLRPRWVFKLLSSLSREYEKCLNVLHGFIDEIIQNKREEFRKGEEKFKEVHPNHGLENTQSIIDFLMTQSGGDGGYTDQELKEELLSIVIAASDTSATAAGFALLLLSKYPKIQEKAYQEVFEIFGESNRPIVKDDLANMKYLELVVKETMRLFPPVPFIMRKINTELNLPSGTILPAGCGILVSIWGAHRDPKYWGPDAEHFDPERFLPEKLKLQHPCSYMPFSNGPRNCVGPQYAYKSVKIVLASILRRFKILGEQESGPIPHIPTEFEIMLRPVDGYPIRVQRRNLKII